MRNLFLVVSFFCLLIATSCSKETELNTNPMDDTIAKLISEHQPYVSPEMQQVLNMIDTVSSPIPIEVLLPGIDNLMKLSGRDNPLPQTRAELVFAIGASNYTVLESKIKVTMTVEQARTFNLKDTQGQPNVGPYVVTIYSAVYYVINPGGVPLPLVQTDHITGINPNGLTERGYAVEEVVPNVLYFLTTYVYAIHELNNNEQVLDSILSYIPYCSRSYSLGHAGMNPAYYITNGLEFQYMII